VKSIEMINMQSISAVIRQFFSSPDQSEPIDYLRRRLPETATLYVVGGSIRDLVIRMVFGNAPNTGDIDIFIKGLADNFSLANQLEGESTEDTDLGGIRWHPKSSGMAFDLCMLQKFLPLKKYLMAATRQNLLDSIDFTINSIVYEINTGNLYEHNCISSIEKRCLGFNTHRYYTKKLLAYRILLLRHKVGFIVSDEVFSFLKYQLSLSELTDLNALFKRKDGKKTAKAMIADYNRICSFGNYADYMTAA
jgi:hypothetical protein